MANAGGLPPIICRGDQLLNLEAEGVPVGLLEKREYDEISAQLEPGDVIVLTSDGVLDALNEDGEEYGRDRLARSLRACCSKPVGEIVAALQRDVEAFRGNALQFDDQTILILRVTE
jgi:sigma-B regulation protein RsbU (phosphoserine phosphatase)